MSRRDAECPLCLEELDITDKSFSPCKCGYKICLWCYHNINEKLNGKCPACRTPYKSDATAGVDPSVVAAAKDERKKRKEKEKVMRDKQKLQHAAPPPRLPEKNLANLRILQRNLVYAVGLPLHVAKEDVLKRKELFGKFGRIIKVAINRKHTHSSNGRPTCSAYITYKREESALEAIKSINGQVIDGRTVRATYGTTKYCSFFLRSVTCNNANCLYLHKVAREEDCFTKEDLALTDRFGGVAIHSSAKKADGESQEGVTGEQGEDSSAHESEHDSHSGPGSYQERDSKGKPELESLSLFSADASHIGGFASPKQQLGPKSASTDRIQKQSSHKLNLPGLTSLRRGFSDSLGWTPAKESTFTHSSQPKGTEGYDKRERPGIESGLQKLSLHTGPNDSAAHTPGASPHALYGGGHSMRSPVNVYGSPVEPLRSFSMRPSSAASDASDARQYAYF